MMFIFFVFSQLEGEFAKSGRWLGGVPPTGYCSVEITGSIAADGKVRKAYKLNIIKIEAEIVTEIFRKFKETYYLTKTETYLRQKHIKTKNGREFTRFSIRNILKNPVYMTADDDAWNYFKNMKADAYSQKEDFDGTYGIMAYSKTVQKTGKSNHIKDISEWIIAVGKHQGIISGFEWVMVQKMLNQNSSKSCHKPKSNASLLSGIIFCGFCGAYMCPKLSSRVNENGERIYDYLCETKEKTKGQDCKINHPNGNNIDKEVCRRVKELSENKNCFIRELDNLKKILETYQNSYEQKACNLNNAEKESEKKIKLLLEALSNSNETAASIYITSQINELHKEKLSIQKQREELEKLINIQNFTDDEFIYLKEVLKNFSSAFDTMNVEQKRMALRRIIRCAEWDGETLHVYLF